MRNMCGTIFYIKTNVLQDFHICMSVPLNATGIRWIAEFTDYNFKVKYCPAKLSNDYDFWSHCPIEEVLKSYSKESSLSNLFLLIPRKFVNWNVLDLLLDNKIKNGNPNLLIPNKKNNPTISPILNFGKSKNKPTFEQKMGL